MKILEIHDEKWDSGLAHYALTLSMELRRRGHEVHFWGAPESHAVEKARGAGLKTREISHPWLSLPGMRSEVSRLAIEIINAHTGSSHTLAVALALGTGIPVVRTRADARPPARHALARFLAARTQAYVAANTRLERLLSEAFPGARVELIFQGIAPPPAAAPLPSLPVVGILGRLDPVKGHDDFLDAAILLHESYPQVRFLAAGGGRPERLSRLKWQLKYLGLNGSLEFLGQVEDALAFIAGCRIGVVASVDSEAVSRSALEWMAMGRPLVATSVGCLPDLVVDGETGFLIPPADHEDMAAAVERLLEDPALAENMGRRARERFERLFAVERFAAETERLYEETIRNLSS